MQARWGLAGFSHRLLHQLQTRTLNAAVFAAVTKRIDQSREIAFDASGSVGAPRHGEKGGSRS